jgi:hypothetical protein
MDTERSLWRHILVLILNFSIPPQPNFQPPNLHLLTMQGSGTKEAKRIQSKVGNFVSGKTRYSLPWTFLFFQKNETPVMLDCARKNAAYILQNDRDGMNASIDSNVLGKIATCAVVLTISNL